MTECPDDEAPTWTDSQEDTVPEGSVPLHRLCDRCSQMFDKWDKVQDWFQAKHDLRLELCSRTNTHKWYALTELMESRQSSHLCEILYSQIEQDADTPLHEPIVCQLGPDRNTRSLKMSLLLNGRALIPGGAGIDGALCRFYTDYFSSNCIVD